MLKKRLIFTLLIDAKAFQLSRNFSLQQVGNLDWLFNKYRAEAILHSIDELVVLNVSKKENEFDSFVTVLEELSKKCFMPIAAGGGIRNVEQAKRLFRAGADKVVLNSALFSNVDLIYQIARTHGQQSVVASVDYRLVDDLRSIYIDQGRTKIEKSFEEAFEHLSSLPIGEVYLTSIEQDGTGRGYDMDTLQLIQNWVNVPIIASGGVGKFEHLYDGMQINRVTGVSTAHLFNFIGNGLQLARAHLSSQGISMASWDYSQLEIR